MPYEFIEFGGGLYAAAMSVDGDDDMGGRVYSGILKWLENSGFELDQRSRRRTMCHMVNPTDEIKNALGYDQMDIYVPIRIRDWTKSLRSMGLQGKREIPMKDPLSGIFAENHQSMIMR